MTFTEKTYERILFALSWVLLGLALASFFCHLGSTIDPNRLFNADTLYAASLYKDLAIDGFSWFGWFFPPAPYFFPDVILFPVLQAITGNYIASTALFGVIQIILLVIGFVCLSRALIGSAAFFETAPLVLTLTLLVLRTNGDEFFFVVGPLYSPVTHAGGMIVGLFTLALVFYYIRSSRNCWGCLATIAILTALTAASDQLFLLEFILPCLASLILSSRSGWIPRRKALLVAMVLSMSSLLGLTCFRLLVVNSVSQYYYSPSVATSWNAFREFSTDMNGVFRNFPALASVWCLCLGLCLIVTLAHQRAQGYVGDNQTWPFFRHHSHLSTASAFAVISAASVVLGTLMLGNYTNIWSFRYLLAAWIFPLGVSGVAWVWFMHERRTLRLLTNTLLSLFVAGWFLISGLPVLSTKCLVPIYYPPLVDCLDNLQERFNLHYGLCNYWYAKTITLLSKKDLRVYQISPNGNPMLWINNAFWYLGERGSRYAHPSYNFVIVDDVSKKLITARIGPPLHAVVCGNSEVWIYDPASTQKLKDDWAEQLPDRIVASSPECSLAFPRPHRTDK